MCRVYNNIIELLKCPLSHKIFNNPYVAHALGNKGMTYEKVLIEEYVLNNKNDPTFNVPIIKQELIKNFVIQDMVEAINEMNKNKTNYSINLEIEENLNNDLITEDKLANINNENNEIKNDINSNNIINEK